MQSREGFEVPRVEIDKRKSPVVRPETDRMKQNDMIAMEKLVE